MPAKQEIKCALVVKKGPVRTTVADVLAEIRTVKLHVAAQALRRLPAQALEASL